MESDVVKLYFQGFLHHCCQVVAFCIELASITLAVIASASCNTHILIGSEIKASFAVTTASVIRFAGVVAATQLSIDSTFARIIAFIATAFVNIVRVIGSLLSLDLD